MSIGDTLLVIGITNRTSKGMLSFGDAWCCSYVCRMLKAML